MRTLFCAVVTLCFSTSADIARAQQTRLASGLESQRATGWHDGTLSFGISAGWLTGQSHERVFYEGDKISELIWDLNDAYILSGDLSIRLLPALKINVRGSFGGNIDSYMEDYDWLGLEYGITDWTDRSQHDDADLDDFARFDMNLQYDLLQTGWLTLGGLLGARFTTVQWSVYGGDYVYTSDAETAFRDVIGSFADDLLGITYEQSYATPYLGVVAPLSVGRLQLSGSLLASPFSFLNTSDDHWLRELTITADFSRTKFFGATAEASFILNPWSEMFLAATAERFEEATGDSTYDYYGYGTTFDLEDGAGADQETLEISIGWRVFN